MKKIYLFFQKLKTKKWLIFYWNEIKVLHVPQSTISSNEKQYTNKKLKKIGKKLRKSD